MAEYLPCSFTGSVNILLLFTLITKIIMLLLSDWQLMLVQAMFGLCLYWMGGGASQQGYRRDANLCAPKSADWVPAPEFTLGAHCLHVSQMVSHPLINPVLQGVTSVNRWETLAASQHIHSDKNVQYLINFSLPFKPP